MLKTCARIKFQTIMLRAVVEAQLIARLHPIPEDPGSNPVIVIITEHNDCKLFAEKTKIKKKRPGMAH